MANVIKVDLKSKVIGPSQSVFMVRPGSNYKLYNFFAEAEGIYADLLGLELSLGIKLGSGPIDFRLGA